MSESDKHALDADTKLAVCKAAHLRQISNQEAMSSTAKIDELKREGNAQVKKSEIAEIKGQKLEVKTKHLHDEMEPQVRKAANMREIQKSPTAMSSGQFEALKREGNPMIPKKEVHNLAKTENINTTTSVADE